MAEKERASEVIDSGDLRKYRTEIPNIVDDMDLTVYEFRLYVHLKRVAGSEGACWQGTRTLAQQCNMSVGMITKAKEGLASKRLIQVQERDRTQGESDLITIADIWPENFAKYSKVPAHTVSTPIHNTNTPVRTVNTPVHGVNERSNSFKKEHSKKEEEGIAEPAATALPKEKTEWQLFLEGLCNCCYKHSDISALSVKDKGILVSEAKKIHDAGYTLEDVRTWYGTEWVKDWRYKKDGNRPTPAQVRSGVPVLRAAHDPTYEITVLPANSHLPQRSTNKGFNAALDYATERGFFNGRTQES